MNKDDEILINSIEDKRMQCEQQYIMTHTAFLDVRQCAVAESHLKYTKHLLYGGYEDAERRIVIFLPDYMESIEDDPLEILRVSIPKGGQTLTHRDYLGSLMALGINRNVTGDIIVRPDGADIIILKSMEDYFLAHYNQAGHTHLRTEIVPVLNLDLGEIHTTSKSDTVASLRLDNIVGSAFNLSRTKAQEAIKEGLIFVNDIQCQKADKEVTEASKIVFRGKGKVILKSIGSKTRKDRNYIELEIYGK